MRQLAFSVALIFALLYANAAFAIAQKILVLGDSLSAPYQIPYSKGWVALLENKLKTTDPSAVVLNSSVVGETSGGGLIRLPGLIRKFEPTIVIIELGGNDGLRGLPLKKIQENLANLIQLSLNAHAKVLLVGMRLPPNYGNDYTSAFYKMYADLSAQYHIDLIPFFLEDVAVKPGMMLEDGIHPSEQAQPILLDQIWTKLQTMMSN